VLLIIGGLTYESMVGWEIVEFLRSRQLLVLNAAIEDALFVASPTCAHLRAVASMGQRKHGQPATDLEYHGEEPDDDEEEDEHTSTAGLRHA
jgi:hypothetical protein